MKKHLLTLSLLLGAVLAGQAQYFGTPVYKAGFDTQDDFALWTTETTPDAGVSETTGASTWTLGTSASPSFSTIDRSSTGSLAVSGGTTDATVTITSAPIDLTNKSNLRVGFYGLDLKSTVGQYTFRFSISADDGVTWTNLFTNTAQNAWAGTAPAGWSAFRFAVPASCEGKTVKLRFSIAGRTPYGSGPAYIDGVFISELPDVDLTVTGAKFADNKVISTDIRKPSYKALTKAETLKADIKNEGKTAVSDATVTLYVNDEEIASETITQSIAPGATYTHTFTAIADLSEPRGEFEILVNVDAAGDAIVGNNELTFYAENTVTGIPYTPDFAGEADYDNWVADYNEDGMAEWFGNNPRNGSFYWNIIPEDDDGYVDRCDAWLLSRPVQLEAGKTYRVEFSAWTDAAGDPNTLNVEYGHSTTRTYGTSIWSSDNITGDNCKNVSATFTVPTNDLQPNDPYYFIFHCKSATTAGELRLSNIKFTAFSLTDAAVTAITAPTANALRYSAAEPVTITVVNNGTTALTAANTTLSYSINDGEPVTEALSAPIAAGATAQFTFAAAADLSTLGKPYAIKAWVTTTGDTGADNNTITVNAVSQVVSLPYVPDFGNASAASDEPAYWTVEDLNNDSYSFTCSYDRGLNSRIWSTGGGLYGTEVVTVNAINEQLESRMFVADEGSYKLVFKTRVGKEGAKVPMTLFVRSFDENGRPTGNTFKIENDGYAAGTDFIQHVHGFTLPKAGIYSVYFHAELTEPADFRMYLSDIRILPASAVDLAVEELIIPTTAISTIKEMPVGAIVRNDGETTVSAFTLTATGPDGTVTKTFENVALEPNSTYDIYFPQAITFATEFDSSTLTVSVAAEGDACESNNAVTASLTKRAVAAVPYNPEPQYVMGEWMTFNNNRDLYRFRADRRIGQGYLYQAPEGVEANDVLASTAIALEKDKNYVFSMSYMVNEGDTTSFKVTAYDAATDTEHTLHTVVGATQSTTMSRITRHFSLPAAGNYNICITPLGAAPSLFVSASMSVAEATALPDLKIVSIEPKATEAVFTDNESVTVTIQNTGAAALQNVPVTLTVGDNVYHALYARPVDKESQPFAVTFTGINLYDDGDYTLVADVPAVADANLADNTMKLTVTSLPVVDVFFEELCSPVSGKLIGEQPVEVLVANRGKGDVKNISLECHISSPVLKEEVVLVGLIDVIPEAKNCHYLFDKKVNMDIPGDYTFDITLAIDGNTSSKSDTLTVTVTSSAKPLDGGVTAITNPTDGVLTAGEQVTVTVKNYSTEVSLNQVPVKAVVKRGDTIVATLTGTVKKIAAGESVDYTFETPVDMTTQGTYTIEASTAIANDVDASNDAVTATVKCLTRDLGVTAIISPKTLTAEGSQDVTIEITNFGEAPVGGFDVSYQIGAMPQKATVTATIRPGEKLEFTFPTQHEFVAVKNYTIIARTLLADDFNPDNDACEATIEGKTSGLDAATLGVAVTAEGGSVVINAAADIKSAAVYTLTGAMIGSTSDACSSTVSLDLNLAKGHYVAVVTTGNGTAALRFMAN